ncbi:hypothetical protein [Bacillus sp. AFS037270]|uniref:hypothetical protein n=1 Tax=Bacillus sp. AFS037270 TaxID=2033499 RepID=UPI00159BE99C|nr:hypothetical protein [Bacillus sp. AFS037270]
MASYKKSDTYKLNSMYYSPKPDVKKAYETGFKINKIQGGSYPKGSFSLQPKVKK